MTMEVHFNLSLCALQVKDLFGNAHISTAALANKTSLCICINLIYYWAAFYNYSEFTKSKTTVNKLSYFK